MLKEAFILRTVSAKGTTRLYFYEIAVVNNASQHAYTLDMNVYIHRER